MATCPTLFKIAPSPRSGLGNHCNLVHFHLLYLSSICKYKGCWKYLAQPGRKQATATKLGIYSTYSPRSTIHFLAHCSNLFTNPIPYWHSSAQQWQNSDSTFPLIPLTYPVSSKLHKVASWFWNLNQIQFLETKSHPVKPKHSSPAYWPSHPNLATIR
jgi:hypothetical protein